MLRLGNVATPLTAFTGAPPESVPLPGFAPSPSVIAPVNPWTTCSAASSAATWTGGAIVAPATAFWGCCVNPRWVGGGGGCGGESVTGARLVDVQIGKGGHAGYRGHRVRRSRELGVLGGAPISAERRPDRTGEIRRDVPERVVRCDLHRRLDRAVLHGGAGLHAERELGGGRRHHAERPAGIGMQLRGRGGERVAAGRLVQSQVREGGDAVYGAHLLCSPQRIAARVGAE